MSYKLIIFDMDGTILDSKKCIFNAIDYVCTNIGIDVIDENDKKKFLGPPIVESYSNILNLRGQQLQEAVAYHKEYTSRKGLDDYTLYPGVSDLLTRINILGVKMGIASMKPISVLTMLCNHYSLPISIIHGHENDETKASLVKKCILDSGVSAIDAVLIGDMNSDKEGAAANTIDFIGVSYGYGFKPGECEVDSIEDLTKMLLE